MLLTKVLPISTDAGRNSTNYFRNSPKKSVSHCGMYVAQVIDEEHLCCISPYFGDTIQYLSKNNNKVMDATFVYLYINIEIVVPCI